MGSRVGHDYIYTYMRNQHYISIQLSISGVAACRRIYLSYSEVGDSHNALFDKYKLKIICSRAEASSQAAIVEFLLLNTAGASLARELDRIAS